MRRALTGVLTVPIFYTLWRGWITISRLHDDERDLLKTPQVFDSSWRLSLLRYLGMPPVVAFLNWRRSVVIALYLAAAWLIGMGMLGLVQQLTILGLGSEISSALLLCERELGPLPQRELMPCANEIVRASMLTFYFSCVLILACLVLGNFLLRVARRRVRVSANRLLASDPRPPILFLRSFRDDQVTLRTSPRTAWLTRLLTLSLPRQPLDHILLEEATPVGPVVALGSPQDALPPYGIARGYFDHGSWQQAVRDLARDSRAIVLCLDDTEGVWWELAHLREAGYFAKTLFLLHPSAADPEEHLRISARLLKELRAPGAPDLAVGDALETRLTSEVVGFYCSSGGVLTVATSSTFSRLAYLLLVRSFAHNRRTGLLQNPSNPS